MQDLRQNFQDLLELLIEESGIYHEMIETLSREKEALLAMRPSELGEICASKEMLALRLKALDESRKLLADRLGRALGIDRRHLTIGALCLHAPGGVVEPLTLAREKLRKQAEACKELNDGNALAARRGLDLLNSAVDHLLSEGDPSGAVYRNKGGYASIDRRRGPAMVSREA